MKIFGRLLPSQLLHDVVTTLGFGCILVATSDNVVINKIYSVCVNAKPSLKWWIFENLQLVA